MNRKEKIEAWKKSGKIDDNEAKELGTMSELSFAICAKQLDAVTTPKKEDPKAPKGNATADPDPEEGEEGDDSEESEEDEDEAEPEGNAKKPVKKATKKPCKIDATNDADYKTFARQQYDNRRAELIDIITGNENNTFTEAQLAAKNIGELEQIAAISGNKVDRSAQSDQGGAIRPQGNRKFSALVPPGLRKPTK